MNLMKAWAVLGGIMKGTPVGLSSLIPYHCGEIMAKLWPKHDIFQRTRFALPRNWAIAAPGDFALEISSACLSAILLKAYWLPFFQVTIISRASSSKAMERICDERTCRFPFDPAMSPAAKVTWTQEAKS